MASINGEEVNFVGFLSSGDEGEVVSKHVRAYYWRIMHVSSFAFVTSGLSSCVILFDYWLYRSTNCNW